MKQIVFLLIFCAILCACATQTPNKETTIISIETATPTPPPAMSPTVDFFIIPRSYIPPATPTFIPVGQVVQDLEVISPENIGRLQLINRWGKGKLLDIKVSPDHTVVAAATSTGVYLYRSQDLRQIGYLNARASDRNSMRVDFSPDGTFLAVAGSGVSIWDIASQTEVGILPVNWQSFQPRSLGFTPDG